MDTLETVFDQDLEPRRNNAEPKEKALATLLRTACDAAMPRKRGRDNGKKSVYWWNDAISDLRSRCIQLRRKLARLRKKKALVEHIETWETNYKKLRGDLRKTIKRAKGKAWDELMGTLEYNRGSAIQNS